MIPRTLHFVWTGPPMPAQYATWIRQWAALHPGWRIRLWGASDLTDLVNQDLFDAADEIAGAGAGQLRSDIARYEILYRHGGVYADCDYAPQKPIDPLCDVDAWAAWETDGEWMANGVLGSVPGHPLWADLIEAIPASVAAHRAHRPNKMTGPQLFTPLAARHGITVYPSSYFHPYRWDELDRGGEDYPDAYAVHHWGNMRRRKKTPL